MSGGTMDMSGGGVPDLLNMEKRTGVKDKDIDKFIKKVDAIQKQLDGLRDGSITVAQLEEKDRAEEERAARRKAAADAARAKHEEEGR